MHRKTLSSAVTPATQSASHPHFHRSISRGLARIVSLRRSRKFRDSTRTFAIEGIRQFIRASEAEYEFEAIYVSPPLLQQGHAAKLARQLSSHGVRKIVLTPEQFRSISIMERASGIIAIARQRWAPLNQVNPSSGIGFLVIDFIRSPGNLGTILRTAEAVGMGGVLFAGDVCDPHDPLIIRATMGALFDLPLIRTRPRELSLWLAQHNVTMLGLSPHASRLWIDPPPATRYALALGEERAGLSNAITRLCDEQILLPMTGKADSLNVSVAAGVMMYEMLRRSMSPHRPVFDPPIARH